MSNSIKFPMWFTVLTVLFFISNLFIFGGAALFNPGFVFPDAGETAVFPIQFFAVRHIAFSVPLLYGLIRKDVKILTVMYSIFIIMSVLDIALLGLYDYYIPVLGLIPAIDQLPLAGKLVLAIGAFLAPVGAGLWYLTTNTNDEAQLQSASLQN